MKSGQFVDRICSTYEQDTLKAGAMAWQRLHTLQIKAGRLNQRLGQAAGTAKNRGDPVDD